MKSYLFLTLFALVSFTLYAQNKDNQEPYLTQSLAKESIKNAEVQTSGGSISVTGVNPSEARIEVYVSANNNPLTNRLSKEEIKKRLEEDYELTIAISNNKVSAKAKPKQKNMNWKKGLNISFRLFVPQATSTELATSGGSIHLENLSGEQDFSTSGGSLQVEKVKGKIKGRTSGGSIHAADCDGTIDLATSGGSLDLTDLEGTIKAQTSGGSIKGRNIAGEFESHTSGGSIKLTDLSCSLETSTSGGNIDVSIKELGKYVKIHNSGGNIDLEIPKNKGINLDLEGQRVNTVSLSNFSGSMNKDAIKGTLNGGGIPVTVRTGGGHIDLSLN